MYNCALEHRIALYRATGRGTSYENQASELPVIKKTEDLKWLGQIPSQTLQAVLERLDKAYRSFFKGGGFPKWAAKGRYRSFTVKSKQDRFSLRLCKNRPTWVYISCADHLCDSHGLFIGLLNWPPMVHKFVRNISERNC